jgi:hypothetical protein
METLAKSIRNTLSVYVLFSLDESKTGDELTQLQYFLREPDSLDYNAIRMCADDNIMYYCYLLIGQKLEMLSNEDIQNMIRKYLSLIEFVYNYSSESNEELINLYRDIKENMKTAKLKRKLKQEQLTFSDTTQFCPISFLENEKVLEIIHKYLTPKETEKNLFGEVFTPVELVCEMLDKLPPDVWRDQHKKWLDPTCGIGNYPIIVYYKLMETLTSIPLTHRSKYIIEKMLYIVELNPVNVALCRKIFKMIDSDSTLNIVKANFLEITDINGINEFDIIIGNPPFQDEIKSTDATKTKKKKPRAGGKSKLYERITIHALSLLRPNGFLLFVTPDNIMTGISGEAYKKFLLYDTILINFNRIQKRYFPHIGQPMCYFLINKHKTPNLKTIITSTDGNSFQVFLKPRAINPVKDWTKETEQLVQRYIGSEHNGFKRSRDGVSITETTTGSISVIMDSNKTIKTNDPDVEGIRMPKYILFRMQPQKEGILDESGKFGIGPQIYYLSLSDYSNNQQLMIEEFFKSTDYRKLQQITTTGQYLKDSFIKSIDINKIIQNHSAKKIQASFRGKLTRKKQNKGGKGTKRKNI